MNKIIKSIVFSGNRLNGYFADEVSRARGYTMIYIDENINVKESISDILFEVEEKNPKCIIVDINQFTNEAKEIAENLSNLKKILPDAKIVAFMPGFNKESVLCQALLEYDIKNFIFSELNGDLKKQLEQNLTGVYEISSDFILENKKETEATKKENEDSKIKKDIAVAGIGRAAGASSLCFHIIKNLLFKGYTACYIEANSSMYRGESLTSKIEKWFEVDNKEHFFRFKDIDIYRKENLSKALDKKYDFYIYDYGDINSSTFESTAFLKEEFKILISHTKPQHLDEFIGVCENEIYKDVILVLNMVSEAHKEDILNLASKNIDRQNIFFSDYIPDMFSYKEKSYIEDILNIKPKEIDKKESGLFKKVFRKKK